MIFGLIGGFLVIGLFLYITGTYKYFYKILYRNKTKILYQEYSNDYFEGYILEEYPSAGKVKIMFFGILMKTIIVDKNDTKLTIIRDRDKNPEYFL